MYSLPPKSFLLHIKIIYIVISILIVLNERFVTYIASIPNTGVMILLALLVLAIVRARQGREPGMLLCTINSFMGVLLFTYLSMFADVQSLSGFYLLINQITTVLFIVALYYSVRTYVGYIRWKHDL